MARKSLSQFARTMKELANAAGTYGAEYKKTICLEVATEIIINTPIRSGQARANWIPSHSAPATGVKTGPGNALGSIGQVTGVVKSAPLKAPIYLTNNLPYIERLNEGYSMQAPAGFVQRAVKTGRQRAKRKLAKLYGSVR